MKDIRTGKYLKDIPILEEVQTYIYVMLNDAGKVKIGKTVCWNDNKIEER